MTRRGRKPTGPQLLDRLDGSAHAKTRLRVILESLAGRSTIPEACEELGIQETMFHKLRSEVLQTALNRLEPRPLGRPPQRLTPEDRRAAALEDELRQLRVELKASRIREELAEKLPRLSSTAGGPGKKTTHSTTKNRHRKRKHSR